MTYDQLIMAMKTARQEQKLTYEEISKRTGVPRPTIQKIFTGATKTPKRETLEKINSVFGFDLRNLEVYGYEVNKHISSLCESKNIDMDDLYEILNDAQQKLNDAVIAVKLVKDILSI